MKLKEVPKSLTTAFKLRTTPVDKLGQGAKQCEFPLVVSLTSIPSRLAILHLTIRSLLNQTVAPEKVILWLHESIESKLPNQLRKLEGNRFEIRYSDQTCSHRKLVETLKTYEGKTIVTCDDDVMYANDWLDRLITEHKQYPSAVIAHECRKITYDNGFPVSYNMWNSQTPGGSSSNTLAIGYGGVLYPPNSLYSDVTHKELYLKITPKADDLWFKAMTLLNGTETRRTSQPNPKPTPIFFSQGVSLKKHNVRQDGNRLQWIALDEHYHLELKLLADTK